MTEEIAAVPDDYQPEAIAPLVVWLCTDEAKEVTGRVFGAHGRHYFEYLTELTPGVEKAEAWSVAEVGARFSELTRAKVDAPSGGSTAAASAAAASASAAAASAAAVAAPSLDALVDQAFARMGEAFVAEKAAGWSSTLHFRVGPSLAYTVEVKDQQVATQKGLAGSPKCTISFDTPETFLGTVSGKIKAQSAFMAGQIKADEMGELMRYAQCFDMRRAASAAASATQAKAATEAAEAPAPPAGLNRALLGKRYKVPAVFVRPEEVRAYADATEDHNPAYERSEGAIAPPLFPVRPLWEAVQAVVFDEGLRVDMLRLVHGEQEMIFHRHLRPWDLVAPRSEVLGIEDKASGQILKVRQVLMCEGELVNETISAYFIRSPQKAAEGGKKEAAPPAPAPAREVVFEAQQRVAEDQPLRYGPASGDINPIHMDHDIARAAGHPSIILHGLCTMAFASKAVVEGVCGGDPNRLKRLFARFSRPVLPGWTLTTRVWSEGEREGRKLYGFETVNQDGVPVLLQGRAEAL
jgi:acyl dehydratase/putative sterol carrier protein